MACKTRIGFLVVAMLGTGSFSLGGETMAKENEPATANLIVHLTADSSDKGLRLDYPKEMSASSVKAIEFPVRVSNLLEDEVFVEVTGHKDLSCDLEANGNLAAFGGSAIGFPDNVNLLKRLHATRYQKGKAITCGCAVAFLSGRINLDERIPLTDWIGETARITMVLKGYYRSNGKEFVKSVELPVKVVK